MKSVLESQNRTRRWVSQSHGCNIFFFFPFSQENTSPLPPTVSDCLRADVRIPVARSQNCSNYPEGLTFTRSFLYPPSEHGSFYSQSLESLIQLDVGLCLNIYPNTKTNFFGSACWAEKGFQCLQTDQNQDNCQLYLNIFSLEHSSLSFKNGTTWLERCKGLE